MRLLHPWLLLLILPAAVAAAWALWRPGGGKLDLPAGGQMRARRPSPRALAARFASPVLVLLALGLVAAALARPQKIIKFAGGAGEGIDIVLSIDSSLSMKAVDIKPTRLDAAKATAKRFVLGRAQDRIGLVTFGGAPLLLCPPTLDYDALLGRLEELEGGMTRADGTAVGDGSAAAISRLKDSTAKSKVAILITDGRSNTGAVDPLTAAKAAAAYGIKVYAIGVGGKGDSSMTIDDPRYGQVTVPVTDDLDEELLSEIARLTDGKAYRAQDGKELKGVLAAIDRLEKSKVALPKVSVTGDLHGWLLITALVLLMLESALAAGPLLRWP